MLLKVKNEGDFLRQVLIAGNWKMNKLIDETEEFCREFLPLVEDISKVEVLICPVFTSLYPMQELFKGSKVKIGGQDVFWEPRGAYTGEISPAMLLDAGCSYVIIGHSERRQIIGESNVIVNRKIKAAMEAGLNPILCVGETLQERENQRALEVVKEQLTESLQDIDLGEKPLVVAYEPVWAIGTGVNASSDDAREMTGFIRKHLARLYNEEIAAATRILYGGSVKEDNIRDFLAEEDVDGALVGGASLKANSFARIIRAGEDG